MPIGNFYPDIVTYYYQFSLFEDYPKPRESIIKLISKLIACENDIPLLEALGTAIENFIKLPINKSYSINFSGGKDQGYFILNSAILCINDSSLFQNIKLSKVQSLNRVDSLSKSRMK